MNNILTCNKNGHQGQQIQGICTFIECKEQRTCCFKCSLNDHNSHIQFIKILQDLQIEYSSREKFELLKQMCKKIVQRLEIIEQLLNDANAIYPKDVNLITLNEFGKAISSETKELRYGDIKQVIDESQIEIEGIFKKILNSINQKDQSTLDQRKVGAEQLIKDPIEQINLDSNLSQQGHFEEVIEIFDNSLVIQQKNQDSQINESVELQKLIRQEEVNKCHNQALSIWTNNIYRRKKVRTLCKLQKFEEALDFVNQLLQLNSNDASTYKIQGTILLYLNRSQEALKSYMKSISIKKSFRKLIFIARALEYFGKKEFALHYYKEALTIDPECKKVKLEIKRLEKVLGKVE